MINNLVTFRTVILEDTLNSFRIYEEMSLDYQHALSHLAELDASPNKSLESTFSAKPEEEIAKLRVEMEETRKKAVKLGEDFSTKMVLLNDKRIHVISKDLQSYTNALLKYYVSGTVNNKDNKEQTKQQQQ